MKRETYTASEVAKMRNLHKAQLAKRDALIRELQSKIDAKNLLRLPVLDMRPRTEEQTARAREWLENLRGKEHATRSA